MKFGCIVRAYAPFTRFGLLFHGDARGPTTSPDVTSRVKSWVVFDPVAGTFETPHSKSDSSSFFFAPGFQATAVPSSKVDVVVIGKNHVHFHMHVRAANPLVPGSAPIDVRLIMTAAVGERHLNINAQISGDVFPNFEVILQDEVRVRRMVHTFETDANGDTGPFIRLWGNRNAHMNSICKTFALNAQGRFQ